MSPLPGVCCTNARDCGEDQDSAGEVTNNADLVEPELVPAVDPAVANVKVIAPAGPIGLVIANGSFDGSHKPGFGSSTRRL